MTAEEFNIKYDKYLERGHYGCDVHGENQIGFLDNMFQKYILIPGFSYSQIKSKFNSYRFYCNGLDSDEIYVVEKTLKQLENE